MDSSTRCGNHADRAAVATCARCGRPVCLDCAIPVRGEVLCAEDAARELGRPLPQAVHVQPSRRPEVVAGTLFVLALVATVPPWHGEGELTSIFSAWRPGLEPWAFVASLFLLGAVTLTLVPVVVGSGPGALIVVGYAALAAFAAIATAVTLIAAPDFFSPTPAPFVTIVLGLIGAGVGFGRLRALRV